MLYICTKFCQSISYSFMVMDLDSRIDAKVVANVDGRTYGPTNGQKTNPYIVPCLRQARQKDKGFPCILMTTGAVGPRMYLGHSI